MTQDFFKFFIIILSYYLNKEFFSKAIVYDITTSNYQYSIEFIRRS